MRNNEHLGNELLRTTVVGSYPQPDWLVNKQILRSQLVPRVRQENLWRVPPELRAEAIGDASLIAINDMESAGIDVITDGETARESYSNHFIAALEGVDDRHPATIVSRTGHRTRVPRIVGAVRHRGPAEVEFARFLREHTRRRAKVTLPGPFTLAQQSRDEHYRDIEALAFDFAVALNTEARLLEATSVDVIQFDEPWLRNDPQGARRFAIRVLNRALEGLRVRTAVHTCFGYAFLRADQPSRSYEFLIELADCAANEISIEAAQPKLDPAVLVELRGKAIALGVLDHSTPDAEPPELVAERIRAALKYLSPQKLLPAPDCGMKYMTRPVAFARLKNLATAAQWVRSELIGEP